MSNRVRVRYAPSPTGHLHIGNARTALYVYLFAKHFDGDMVLRIEDTDIERNVEGGEESQAKYLHWLGIDWNEGPDKGGEYGPYRQLERLDLYKQYANELIEKGHAYKCYCTEEEIAAEREAQLASGLPTTRYSGKCRHLTAEERAVKETSGAEYTVRFAVPENETYEWDDIVRSNIKFESKDIGDWVLVKKNGIATYNYAVVVDDALMKISHVLRGEEHISNTPKQLMVYRALDWVAPDFGHMAVIVNENRKKLSKRDESVLQFIEQYQNLGYLPEALFNFIALLGWSPVGEEEMFSKEEFIKIFDPSRLSSAPAMFDKQKLTWINNRYIKELPLEKVVEISLPHLINAGYANEERTAEENNWITNLVALYQDQMSFGAEIVELSSLFFKDVLTFGEEEQAVISEEQVKEVLSALVDELNASDEFTVDSIKASIKNVQKATGQKGKKLFMPIRVAATGQCHGPELPAAMTLLGKEKVIARLQHIIG